MIVTLPHRGMFGTNSTLKSGTSAHNQEPVTKWAQPCKELLMSPRLCLDPSPARESGVASDPPLQSTCRMCMHTVLPFPGLLSVNLEPQVPALPMSFLERKFFLPLTCWSISELHLKLRFPPWLCPAAQLSVTDHARSPLEEQKEEPGDLKFPCVQALCEFSPV